MENLIQKFSEQSEKIQLLQNIATKKRENINQKIKNLGISSESLYAFCDSTLFQSCKEGLGFSSDSLIFIDTFASKAEKLKYTDITDLSFVYNKKNEIEKLKIDFINGKSIEMSDYMIKAQLLHKMLNEIIELGKTQEFERNTIIVLEDQPSEVKLSYIDSIIKAIHCIDQRSLLKVYSIMNILKFTPEERFQVKELLVKTPETIVSADNIINNLTEISTNNNLTTLELKIIQISLIKDLVNIYVSSEENPIIPLERIKEFSNDNTFLDEIIKLEKMNLDLISGKINDEVAKKVIKESSAKLSAIGVPMVAIYFSGSVLGFSAAGITSALSALGLGGFLGLSSMVTGIGVVILTGVVAYKTVSWIVGGKNEENKRQFRDELIKQALLSNQRTANMIVEDMVLLTEKFVTLAEKLDLQKLQASKLIEIIKMFQKAASNSAQQSNTLNDFLNDGDK